MICDTMDPLDRLITSKAEEIAELDAKLADFESRLRDLQTERRIAVTALEAFRLAAQLRPPPPGDSHRGGSGEAPDSKRRGRQPGSISQDWRRVLGYLFNTSGPHDYAAIHEAAHRHGIQATYASIRDRVRDYTRQGLLDGSPEEGFLVTADAVEKFNLFGNEFSDIDDMSLEAQDEPAAPQLRELKDGAVQAAPLNDDLGDIM